MTESKNHATETESLVAEDSQKSSSFQLQASRQKVSTVDVSSKSQRTIKVGIEKTREMTIQRSNNEDLETAKVDFFRCKNIPENC